MLGRTKDQIRTTEQVNAALTACRDLKLDGLVIIGGISYPEFKFTINIQHTVINFLNIHLYFLKGSHQTQTPLNSPKLLQK